MWVLAHLAASSVGCVGVFLVDGVKDAVVCPCCWVSAAHEVPHFSEAFLLSFDLFLLGSAFLGCAFVGCDFRVVEDVFLRCLSGYVHGFGVAHIFGEAEVFTVEQVGFQGFLFDFWVLGFVFGFDVAGSADAFGNAGDYEVF